MTTPTEEILNTYKKTEKVTDALGRVLWMRMLRPSTNMQIVRMAETEMPSVLTNYFVAASVSKIDCGDNDAGEGHVGLPKEMSDINWMLDRLGQEGIRAASRKYLEMNGYKLKDDKDEDGIGAALIDGAEVGSRVAEQQSKDAPRSA